MYRKKKESKSTYHDDQCGKLLQGKPFAHHHELPKDAYSSNNSNNTKCNNSTNRDQHQIMIFHRHRTILKEKKIKNHKRGRDFTFEASINAEIETGLDENLVFPQTNERKPSFSQTDGRREFGRIILWTNSDD